MAGSGGASEHAQQPGDEGPRTGRDEAPIDYEISVAGHLGARTLARVGPAKAHTSGRRTVLVMRLEDQSALHAALARIRDLGLELMEVRRRGDEPGVLVHTRSQQGDAARRGRPHEAATSGRAAPSGQEEGDSRAGSSSCCCSGSGTWGSSR
jgi:hypothetical protein